MGTLNLPGNSTFTNVLRVKNVLNLTFFSGFLPLGSAKETSYSYYHGTNKFPLLTITYLSFALTGSQPTLTSFITGNTNYFTVGVRENTLDASYLSMYPNPFTSSLQLEVNGQLHPQEIKIYSQLGQLVYAKDYNPAIDLAHLQSGIYLVEVKTDQGILRKKLVKE
jgi:type IX secretion system substrate protein